MTNPQTTEKLDEDVIGDSKKYWYAMLHTHTAKECVEEIVTAIEQALNAGIEIGKNG